VVVADTHALIWWVSRSEMLSGRARSVLDQGPVGFTVITCMEIAFLVRRKRIDLSMDVNDWLEQLQALPNVLLLPMTLEVAVAAANLPDTVRDPSDRLIVAQAILQGLPLVTKDRQITASGLVPTIW
jgi:PIN domain nuclease of toxin-antitoxin system